MPAFRNLDGDQQAEILQQRADATRLPKAINDITATLKKTPHAAELIKKELKRHGISIVDTSIDRKRKSGDDTTGDLSSPAKVRLTVEDPNPKNWIPHKYTRFDNTSTEVLGSLLAHIEPITFGKFAMRAVRSQRQQTFLELLEFATRLPRSTHLTGDLRHLPTLREKLEEAATAQQHRSRELVLPPDWSRQGIFQIRMVGADDNDIVFLHLYNRTARPWPLPLRLRDREGALIGMGNLALEQNHFEESALVKSPLCMDTFRVANLGSFDTQPEKKRSRRLALPAPLAGRSGSPRSPSRSPPGDRLALQDSPPGSPVSHAASRSASAVGSATAPVHRSSARLGRAMKGASSAGGSDGHTSSASASSLGEQRLNLDSALEQTLEGQVDLAPSGDLSMGSDGQLGDVSGGWGGGGGATSRTPPSAGSREQEGVASSVDVPPPGDADFEAVDAEASQQSHE